MRVLAILLTLTLSVNAFSATRPGGKKGQETGTKGEVSTARVTEAYRGLNDTLFNKTGLRPSSDLDLSRLQLNSKEVQTLEARINDLAAALKAKELGEDTVKKEQLVAILDGINVAFGARPALKKFAEDTSQPESARQLARNFSEAIMNLFAVLKAKVEDDPSAPESQVSAEQIMALTNLYGRIEVGRDLTIDDIKILDTSARDILKKYSIEDVAKCI